MGLPGAASVKGCVYISHAYRRTANSTYARVMCNANLCIRQAIMVERLLLFPLDV